MIRDTVPGSSLGQGEGRTCGGSVLASIDVPTESGLSGLRVVESPRVGRSGAWQFEASAEPWRKKTPKAKSQNLGEVQSLRSELALDKSRSLPGLLLGLGGRSPLH
jgi:hypothetical protein